MRTVEKFEIGFGLATLATASLFFYASIKRVLDPSNIDWDLIIKIFLLVMLPAILTTIGSVAHVVGKSKVGFAVLGFGSGVLGLFFAVMLFSLGIFYYFGWIGGLFATTPGVFAILTLIVAVYSRRANKSLG